MPLWRVTARVRHGQFDWPGTIERYLDAPDEEAALAAVAETVREDGHHVDSSSAEPIPPVYQDQRDAHARGVWAKTNNQQ